RSSSDACCKWNEDIDRPVEPNLRQRRAREQHQKRDLQRQRQASSHCFLPNAAFPASHRSLASSAGKDSLNQQMPERPLRAGTGQSAAAKELSKLMGLSVVVVGGGIGGLFTANALIAHGFNVTVCEQAPALGE